MNKKLIKLSIIIVYYGGYKNLLKLLSTIKNSKLKTSYEIILVNNKLDENIEPKIKKLYKDIKFVKSPGNVGYSRGNNLGAETSKGKYLLIINPDTEIVGDSINVLVKFLDSNKNVSIVAPNLIYKNGNFLENIGSRTLTPFRAIIALSFINKMFPNNPISRKYFLKDLPKNTLREVDTVPGTAFMIRRNVFDEIGGFDENFFLYFEEFDLCKRVRELGQKICINPKAVAVHDWKTGDGGKELKKYFEQSRFYYFKKHYGIFSAFIVEFFTRFSKWHAIILLFLAFVVIFRLKLI